MPFVYDQTNKERFVQIYKALSVDVSAASGNVGAVWIPRASGIWVQAQVDALSAGDVTVDLDSSGNTEAGEDTAPAATQFASHGSTAALAAVNASDGVGAVNFSPWVDVSWVTTGTPVTATVSFWLTVRRY